MSVSSISSPTVMIFEFDWKPRCVMIMSANSLAMSVLLISSADGVIVTPRAELVPTVRLPELLEI